MLVHELTSRFRPALRLPRRSCAESTAFEVSRLNLGSTPVHLGDPVQWVNQPWFTWSSGQLVLTSQRRSATGQLRSTTGQCRSKPLGVWNFVRFGHHPPSTYVLMENFYRRSSQETSTRKGVIGDTP
ncbi:hypothetical protein PIB30_062520 [Stylosanthes scabra]|uniref:Uncharacterized protein n=1 Tax=Stylosanthes scabra TaxID=79078 RepID=A0ABU6ZJV0_9FABA|nr:hypothetical protein [Stylosanthes scabra]